MAYTKRFDGRKHDEMRQIKAEIGIIPNADGSALFAFGETVAIVAVYGPKPMHPQHMQNPRKGVLRCTYDMLTFSVPERKKPGPNRRSHEISKVIEWALSPVLHLDEFPNTVVDVYIMITQANASTRCAGINAASLALAHAGLPMSELVSSVSVGKMDKTIVVDVIKEEEDYEGGEGATDIATAFLSNSGKLGLLQIDGCISQEELQKAVELARSSCEKITEIQKKALKKLGVQK